MEISGFFINPVHVAAIGEIKGGAAAGGLAVLPVFYVGADEAIMLRFNSLEEAKKARDELIIAIGLAR